MENGTHKGAVSLIGGSNKTQYSLLVNRVSIIRCTCVHHFTNSRIRK